MSEGSVQRGVSGRPRTFVREATGLTRELSLLDIFVYNTNNQNIGLGALFILLFVPAFYPGASMLGGALLAALLALPHATTYAFFAATMPRSGGDYVYISRTLSPLLGFVSSFNWLVWLSVYIGIPAAYFGQYGLSSLFRLLAANAGDPTLMRFADFWQTPLGIFSAGTLLIVGFGAVFAFGTKLYFRIQNAAFVVATLGVAVAGIIALVTPREVFAARFDAYVQAVGGVADALRVAQEASGEQQQPFSIHQTFLSLSLPLYIMLFSITSSFVGGEIKSARRAQFFGMPGSVLYCTLWIVFLVAAFQTMVGYDRLATIGAVDPAALGLAFTPTFIELAGAVVHRSLPLVLLVGIGFVLWTYVWLPINYLASTRILLAWSFDRLMPEKLSYVSPRTHTPLVAILVVGLLGELCLALYAWNIVLASVVGIFGWIVSFILTAIAAIVFPYRRRADFEASPVRWRLAGLPVMTLVGGLALVSLLVCEVVFWLDPFVGLAHFPNVQALTVAVFVVAVSLYWLVKTVQARRGIRIEYAFREIPPE
ncbi:MAG: APC family permease [Thermomicrobium sp.]|nr:APC family permease [Thermomicrobium sp.]